MQAIRRLTAAALVLVASTAAAQGGQGAGQQRSQEMQERQNGRMFKGITLSEVQKKTIDSIQTAGRTAMQGMMKAGGMMQADSMRDSRGMRDSGRMRDSRGMRDTANRGHMMEMRRKQRADIRAVLTAEQQTIYDKNLAEMPQMGTDAGRRPPR